MFFLDYLPNVLIFLALIVGILNVDPQERMKLSDIASHPWCMRCAILNYIPSSVYNLHFILGQARLPKMAGLLSHKS